MPKRATVYLETTEVPPERSAAEIVSLLVRTGAREVAMRYAEGGRINGIAFTIQVDGHVMPFSLPARTERLYDYLRRQAKGTRGWWDTADQQANLRSKAERIACLAATPSMDAGPLGHDRNRHGPDP